MAKPGKGKKSDKTKQKATKTDTVPVSKTAPEASGPVSSSVKQEAVVAETATAKQGNPIIRFIKSYFSIYTIGILAVMAIMLYIRVVPSWNNVFTNWPWINGTDYVNVDMSDSVYTMHLVYNTIAHFPTRIMYDPFTNFPYGSEIHFGPLFTIAIAFSAIVVGLGHPSTQLVAMWALYSRLS